MSKTSVGAIVAVLVSLAGVALGDDGTVVNPANLTPVGAIGLAWMMLSKQAGRLEAKVDALETKVDSLEDALREHRLAHVSRE